MLFLIVSLIGITILVIRRFVVKGELGGGKMGRIISCILFVALWFVYVIISSLAQYEIVKF